METLYTIYLISYAICFVWSYLNQEGVMWIEILLTALFGPMMAVFFIGHWILELIGFVGRHLDSYAWKWPRPKAPQIKGKL